jgi:hypothetical protein
MEGEYLVHEKNTLIDFSVNFVTKLKSLKMMTSSQINNLLLLTKIFI